MRRHREKDENGRTNPRYASAPLPDWIDDADIKLASPELLEDELRRASTELMWALHRQRAAWKVMAQLKEYYDGQSNFVFVDNERRWKLAVGDVQWWRGEVNSRANAVHALCALAAVQDVKLGPDWVEVTNPADMAAGRRTFVPARPIR